MGAASGLLLLSLLVAVAVAGTANGPLPPGYNNGAEFPPGYNNGASDGKQGAPV